MLIDPNVAYVDVWSRGTDRVWSHQVAEGLENTVRMPAIGVTLALAEIYEGVEFPQPGSRLVRREEPPVG
jgi:hypothetical protein